MSIDDDDEATRILPSHAPKAGSPAQRTEIAPERTEIAPPAGSFDPDGDATVIRPRPPPPAPQRVPSAEGGNMLPVGFYLGEFEIVKVLGEGGFGIVYLADDHSLDRRVALKEYMPSSLAQRVGGTQVLGQVGAAPRNLRGRPEELRQRGAAARPVRPSVAGQGLSLLGSERHGLHGDAVLRRHHAQGRAQGDGRAARRRRGCASCWSR